MIGFGKDLIISACYRVPAANLRIGKGTAQCHQSANGPCTEINGRGDGIFGTGSCCSENAHANYKAYYQHGEGEEVEFVDGPVWVEVLPEGNAVNY